MEIPYAMELIYFIDASNNNKEKFVLFFKEQTFRTMFNIW